MEGFPTLPIEVARMIMTEAVKARGLERATRLRFVSRSWKREVTDAIIGSGLLDGHKELPRSPFWPEYLMRHLVQTHRPLSRALRMMRLAAECVVAFRSGKALGSGSDDPDAVRQYLWEICQLFPRNYHSTQEYQALFLVPEIIAPIHETDEDFKLVLLAAAAATNDVALVEQLLPTMPEGCALGHIGHPLEVAAARGHVKVVRLLLGAIREPSLLKTARDKALVHAAECNQMETLELCLLPRYESYEVPLITALELTTSPDVFERVFSLCKDHMAEDHAADTPPGVAPWWPTPEQERQDRLDGYLMSAVTRGDLIMMERLVQLGASLHSADRMNQGDCAWGQLVFLAAAHGRTEVAAYLLERGIAYNPCSLDFAARYGNADGVRLLLEHGAADHAEPVWEGGRIPMGEALLEAVERENEPVVRLLLEWDNPPEKGAWQRALDTAEERGLSSMVGVLNGYKYSRRWVRT
ncbi:ankyrin [Apiospora rasikravindrae]|uniref:Ankyrin n=1 Tax=Apiospora rasikravindrae TaxID=990691 RepID=A0ABR1U2M0_9PEZI